MHLDVHRLRKAISRNAGTCRKSRFRIGESSESTLRGLRSTLRGVLGKQDRAATEPLVSAGCHAFRSFALQLPCIMPPGPGTITSFFATQSPFAPLVKASQRVSCWAGGGDGRGVAC